MTLNGVPNVIYFTDRPARKAGHLSLEKFVESWNKGSDSFKADPPNATLSVLKKDGAKNVVVEIMSVKQKNGSVVFKVAVLEGRSPESFNIATMFMDLISLGDNVEAVNPPVEEPNTGNIEGDI